MPGVAPLGAVGAPVYAQPNVGGEIAQAVGQYPEQKQKYDLQQAEIDAGNIDNATKRLSVLTQLFSASPAAAQNPQLMQATQRAFQTMGLAAPTKTVNGQQVLDTDALAAFGPAMNFMSSNLATILSLPPTSRASTIEAITGQQLSPELEGKIASLPQRTMTSNDLGPLLTTVRQSVLSLGKPGGSIDNVIATMKTINPLLQQLGTSINVDDFAPDIYAMELQKATLAGMDAKTAKAKADADLDKAKAAIQPDLGQAALDRGSAAETSASASVSRAASYAQRTPAAIAKDYATADHLEAQVQDLTGGGGGKSTAQHMQTLTTTANQARALYERLSQDVVTDQAMVDDPSATPEAKSAAQSRLDQDTAAMNKAQKTAIHAQQTMSDYQNKQTHGTAFENPQTSPKYGHAVAKDAGGKYVFKHGDEYVYADGTPYKP